jgi:hypothetical protein
LPEATVPADVVTIDCERETVPGVTVMVGRVDVTLVPPIVDEIVVAVPAVVPVKIAVYVPLLLSVVAEIEPELVPPDRAKTTVRPPALNWLPLASFAVNVSVTLPPDAVDDVETLTRD